MSNDPSDVTRELAKLRELLKLAEGNPGLQKSLIEAIGKTASIRDRHEVLCSRWLSAGAVQRVVTDVVRIVSEEVSDVDVIDRIIARITKIDVRNTTAETKQITQRKI